MNLLPKARKSNEFNERAIAMTERKEEGKLRFFPFSADTQIHSVTRLWAAIVVAHDIDEEKRWNGGQANNPLYLHSRKKDSRQRREKNYWNAQQKCDKYMVFAMRWRGETNKSICCLEHSAHLPQYFTRMRNEEGEKFDKNIECFLAIYWCYHHVTLVPCWELRNLTTYLVLTSSLWLFRLGVRMSVYVVVYLKWSVPFNAYK